MSNLVRFIARHYGSASACSIGVAAVCVAVLSSAAVAEPKRLFCALIPHFKDEYWLSVGYGLEQEAKRENVDLLFFEAGGYRARAKQIEQLDLCVKRGVDAILIGAVTSDHPDLITAIDDEAGSIPIFGLVNELHADTLDGRIGVDWQDMGAVVGRHLNKLHPGGSPPQTAVFITGPPMAGWTGPLEAGLRDGLTDSAVTLAGVYGADTGLRAQLALVESALEEYPNADYLIGSAPAVEAAIGLLASRPGAEEPLLVATYASHTIKRGLMNGSVLAASFDDPIRQGRMAIRQATSPTSAPIGPSDSGVLLLTNGDDNLSDIRMSPAGYFPSIQ
ncbi:TMAO reductase system periplasmic protein TorT [Litoreibacter halocynthiae]|uniref:TMAO reductase system periplasmic protein TorT n=1 Tax=Litoreibacter halocynthiae TaxID=1242689 RepID=UPI0024935F07|nr:TMAO reductase system periplasmic protein TorT [Litoreibacter halocynthiae]